MNGVMKAGAFLLGWAVVLVALSSNVLRAQGLEPEPAAAARHSVREVRAVHAGVVNIKISGPIDLRLQQAATASMAVHAEQRLLPNITTVQQGDTLHIDVKGFVVNSRQPMVVELALPALRHLQVRGSGDSKVRGFTGDALQLGLTGSGKLHFAGQYQRIKASLTGSGNLLLDGGNSKLVELSLLGSGDLTARGSSKSMTAALTGSGDLRARDLVADAVSIKVLGSGDATVFAKTAININGKGSGDVRVHGQPTQRATHVMGSGDVHWE